MAENALKLPADPFRLVARIAHGGMATIYVGQQNEQRVAVKLLHPHLAEDPHIGGMFLHEAQLASRLEHPNVVHVIDHGEHPVHGTFIVMHYVEGGDLSALIEAARAAKQRLPIDVVLRIGIDLCRGLEAAHTLVGENGAPLNLIHRDVSPHNILVGTDGVARLTDFGIAKSDERYTMTSPGQLRGKLAYMAPEQLAHEDDLDSRVDVFSAGVVLFEALTGRRLFKADDEISTINKVLLERVPPPSDHRAELAPLDAVIKKALAREREDRWPSAAAFADALEEASRGLGGPAERDAVKTTVLTLLEEQLEKRASKIRAGSLTNSGIFVSQAPLPAETAAMVEPTPARGPWLWVLVLALVLGAGGLGAMLAGGGSESESENAPVPESETETETETESESESETESESEDVPVPESESEIALTPGSETVGATESETRPEGVARVQPGTASGSSRRRRSTPSGGRARTPSGTSDGRDLGDDLYPNPFRD